MRKIGIALFSFALLWATAAFGQNYTPPPYPQGAIPVGKSVSGTTATVTVSLPTKSGYTTLVCSFIITSGATSSAAIVNATLTGLSPDYVDGSTPNQLSFEYVFVSSGQGLLGAALPFCIPASAQNTAITLTVPGGGTGTNITAMIQGYLMKGSVPQ